MRLLCDQHVPSAYINAIDSAEGFTAVRTVDVDDLEDRSPDTDIIAYAEDHDWVVFTGDQRFLLDDEGEDPSYEPIGADCGVIIYKQTAAGTPGEAVDAIREIAEQYADQPRFVARLHKWTDRDRSRGGH